MLDRVALFSRHRIHTYTREIYRVHEVEETPSSTYISRWLVGSTLCRKIKTVKWATHRYQDGCSRTTICTKYLYQDHGIGLSRRFWAKLRSHSKSM
ncbi:uncharacterized protein LAJ45_03455 [Morchella importuna]|uniref:uncharacterized protein n=1 Tax=Morchella importuna TaxID=1174673 RepID=UPI001E8D975A|nr:uncharacterized protein LAJ45_03455 [Morchella importuna]KAH8152614.1 hypothetical protein LAJ45_03455 [Morchella importuna]